MYPQRFLLTYTFSPEGWPDLYPLFQCVQLIYLTYPMSILRNKIECESYYIHVKYSLNESGYHQNHLPFNFKTLFKWFTHVNLVMFYAHKKKRHFKNTDWFNINFRERQRKNVSRSKKMYYLRKKRQREYSENKSAAPNTCAIKSVSHESWKHTNSSRLLGYSS